MSVDELLDMMEEVMEEGTGLPFTGGKRMVDVEKLQEIIDEIRLGLPTEIHQAKAIVNDRADIVAGARKEADGIVRKAEERARVLVARRDVLPTRRLAPSWKYPTLKDDRINLSSGKSYPQAITCLM